MNSKPIHSAQDYHQAVSYERHHLPRHWLDWSHAPKQGKTYPSAVGTRLEVPAVTPEMSLWDLMGTTTPSSAPLGTDLGTLSGVLGTAYGVTAQRKMGGELFRYRSVPSAGALYPAEIYLASPGGSDLPQGLYHYDIHTFSLTRLRDGNPMPALSRALWRTASLQQHVSFLISGIYFRSAWKYLKRAYRYVLLDAGHLIENLVLSQKMFGMVDILDYDFDDDGLSRLVGLDPKREACLACLHRREDPGTTGAGVPDASDRLPPLTEAEMSASQVSSREIQYPEIDAMARISSRTASPVEAPGEVIGVMDRDPVDWFPIEPLTVPSPAVPFVEAVRRRRSSRNFKDKAISAEDFTRLLDLVCAPMAGPADKDDGWQPGLQVGFLAGRLAGVDPGLYLVSRSERSYGLVSAGNYSRTVAEVCLDQTWLKFSSVQFLFMANLRALDDRWGPRGYRYAMMDAGRLAQRLYLGAAALGLGCCGIGALYDNEAKQLLDLNDGSYLLYLVALGSL